MCLLLKPVFSRDRRGLPNFMDEPFNGLDKEKVKDIRQILIKEKEKGTTILLSSHNSDDIDLLCDRCYHFDAGKLV